MLKACDRAEADGISVENGRNSCATPSCELKITEFLAEAIPARAFGKRERTLLERGGERVWEEGESAFGERGRARSGRGRELERGRARLERGGERVWERAGGGRSVRAGNARFLHAGGESKCARSSSKATRARVMRRLKTGPSIEEYFCPRGGYALAGSALVARRGPLVVWSGERARLTDYAFV
eukprot:862921-Pleurochrysis_carterae.AAC.1